MKLEELNPQGVWKNFYALTQIPRPSGKKEEIGRFLVEYGKSLGLETIQDYIDVSIEQSRKSLDTLKDEQDRNLRKKWKKAERGNSIRIIAGTMK